MLWYIYIYFFVSGALKKRQDSLLRDLRSNNDKLKSEGSSRPPTNPTIFSQIWATDFFFWSFLLREYLNNHGKSYVTFFYHNQQQVRALLFFNKSTNLVLVGLRLKVFGFQGDGDEGSRICRRGGPLDTCFLFLLIVAFPKCFLRQKKSEKAVRRLKHFWQLKARV